MTTEHIQTTSAERTRGGVDILPEPREDIYFENLDNSAAEKLAEAGVIVLTNFLDRGTTDDVRLSARNRILVASPMLLGRRILSDLTPDSIDLPRIFRRKALTQRIHSRLPFKTGVEMVLHGVEGINDQLYTFPVLSNIYGDEPYSLTDIIINKTPSENWFPEHQDAPSIRGFGFAIQTEDTLWHVMAQKTNPESRDFIFSTAPGDLVVLRQRVREWHDEAVFAPSEVGERYYIDGSVVHRGMNLSERARYNISLFSVEKGHL